MVDMKPPYVSDSELIDITDPQWRATRPNASRVTVPSSGAFQSDYEEGLPGRSEGRHRLGAKQDCEDFRRRNLAATPALSSPLPQKLQRSHKFLGVLLQPSIDYWGVASPPNS